MSNASIRRTLKSCLLILANFAFLGIAQAQLEIWMAPRTDGGAGTGTVIDPYNVGTQQKFDALIGGYYMAGKANITFHLAPGTYHSMGAAKWLCLSNWKFHGAGMDNTVIKMSGFVYTGTNGCGGNTLFRQEPWFKTGIEITDLTIDCSWLDFGSTLAGSFTVPALGMSVSVPVVSSTWATIGKRAYIQRMDNHQVVGTYEVASVTDARKIVLKSLRDGDPNAQGRPHGTFISGTAVFVGPAVNTCGVEIGAKDCKVERVHVTNSGTPIYESVCGIAIRHINNAPAGDPFYLADGNIVRDCVIDNLWGSAGSCISVDSNNPNTGNTGTFISVVVENNIAHSNGMHHGLSCMGAINSIWSNNTVTNCRVGWFVDTGYNEDVQITNNTFVNNHIGIQFGGGYVNGWLRFAVSGNHILVPQGGAGILTNGEVHQSVFTNNQILAPVGTWTGAGFQVNPAHTDANIYSNNVVSAKLLNIIPSSAGSGFNNTTLAGSPIHMFGPSPLVERAVKASGGMTGHRSADPDNQ